MHEEPRSAATVSWKELSKEHCTGDSYGRVFTLAIIVGVTACLGIQIKYGVLQSHHNDRPSHRGIYNV
jgi:hypothetical protein